MRQVLSLALAIAFPLAAAAEVLKKEPAVASMPTGSIVYVDDGTCPTAQIKKVVIGSSAQNIPRVRSCVSLDTMRAEEAAASSLAQTQSAGPFDGIWLGQTNICSPPGNWMVGNLRVTASKFTLISVNQGLTKACAIEIQPDGTFSNQACDVPASGWIKDDIMELHNVVAGGNAVCDKLYKRDPTAQKLPSIAGPHVELLRQAIDALRSGNLDLYSSSFKKTLEANQADDQRILARYGATKSIDYSGLEGRTEVYKVEFAHVVATFRMIVDNGGKITGLAFKRY
jgi:hypothetical protein